MNDAPAMTLHGYWRSGAAYRVRIALNLKGLAYGQIVHDLRTGAQRASSYKAIAPQGLVPALDADGTIVTQSMAILEWIEERWPAPALLPADADGRAAVRAMAALIACDIHPLGNLRVLQALKADFGATETQIQAWIARWIGEGFAALDILVGRHGGRFAFGDTPTFADCLLIPQVYSAERFGVSMKPFPRLAAVADHTRTLTAFAAAHPAAQPDADPA